MAIPPDVERFILFTPPAADADVHYARHLTPLPDLAPIPVEAIRHLPSVPMSLLRTTASDAAIAAMSAMATVIEAKPGKAGRTTKLYLGALAAIVADLLTASQYNPPHPCYRPMGAADFTDQHVGYHSFRRVFDDLNRHGFIEVSHGAAPFGGLPGTVTRITPTSKLTAFLAPHGITPHNRRDHFDRTGQVHLSIQLRATSRIDRKHKKHRGDKMPVDKNHPVVARYAAQVDRINTYLAKQRFSCGDDVILYRGFNCGDQPDFNWNKGGRLNCLGGGYQGLSKDAERLTQRADYKGSGEHRGMITINGEATVEVDVSACHLTIAHGLLGRPLPSGDIYHIEGEYRWAVKAFANYMIGKGELPTKWHPDHVKVFRELTGKTLGKTHPIKHLSKIVIKQMPILMEVVNKGLNWADFQFIESEILTKTVETLAYEYDIASLPVHDSIIIPKSSKNIAIKVFSDSFHHFTGEYPVIK